MDTPTPASLSCPECDRTFASAGGLAVHRAKRHSVAGHTATPKDPTLRKRPDGAVQCPTCHDWFVSPSALGPHRRHRHGYRKGQPTEQYLCARCPEIFISADQRQAHEATHPKVEPELKPLGRNPTTRRDGVPADAPVA